MDNPPSEEQTFKKYTPEQAKAFASHRISYNDKLLNVILDHHRSTGGSMGMLVDVGCGPGNSVRGLAKHFDNAYGLDPSPEMINIAKLIGKETEAAETRGGARIDFSVGRAEDMTAIKESGLKVDLLTAAMAAHWFDMPHFWKSAAEVVTSGGTVALWTRASSYCHPSTPHAAEVQKIKFRLEREELAPYELPGNRIAQEGYANLLLPWNVNPPVQGFSQAGFIRKEWDKDGQLSDGEHFFLGDNHMTLTKIQKAFGTASMVTRWREDHPELVETDQDIVNVMAADVRKVTGQEELIIGTSCHLLLFKRE